MSKTLLMAAAAILAMPGTGFCDRPQAELQKELKAALSVNPHKDPQYIKLSGSELEQEKLVERIELKRTADIEALIKEGVDMNGDGTWVPLSFVIQNASGLPTEGLEPLRSIVYPRHFYMWFLDKVIENGGDVNKKPLKGHKTPLATVRAARETLKKKFSENIDSLEELKEGLEINEKRRAKSGEELYQKARANMIRQRAEAEEYEIQIVKAMNQLEQIEESLKSVEMLQRRHGFTEIPAVADNSTKSNREVENRNPDARGALTGTTADKVAHSGE